MKAIILTDTFLPYKGGGQVWVWEAAKRLVKKYPIKIEIVTRCLIVDGEKIDKNEELFGGRLKIKRLGSPAEWNDAFSRIIFIFQSIFYLLKQDFDLIDAQAFIPGIPGKIVSIIKKKPVIFTVNGTSLEIRKASVLEKIILTKIRYDAEISAASNFLKFNNVNKDIFIINPGVDSIFYKPDPILRQGNRILFVGRLQKIKGITNLLRCIDELKQESVKFVLVGDGEESIKIKNFIAEGGIKNVELKGELNREETREEYQKASVFILPSQSEGFPLTILEAMACGLPIIASSVGDIPKLIEDGINGYVIDSSNYLIFCQKIKQLLGNKKLREMMGKNNIDKAKKYDWNITVDKIYKIYRAIL